MTTLNKSKSKGLGRGLGALLPQSPPIVNPQLHNSESSNDLHATTDIQLATGEKRTYFSAQIEDIYPSPDQPRRRFDETLLGELAQSIREHGIIQPLIVRKRNEGGYFLIAGERRWRAAQRASLLEVPIVVQSVSSQESFERAIVENIQRADLNVIEEALAFQRLTEEFSLTQEQIAIKVGKERSTIANTLRLLKLPVSVREMVEDGRIGMGHARALLGLKTSEDMEICARTVTGQGLSARATEALVRNRINPPPAKPPTPPKSPSVRDLEHRLTQSLGSAVSLSARKSGTGGQIAINYSDLSDLDRLLEILLPR